MVSVCDCHLIHGNDINSDHEISALSIVFFVFLDTSFIQDRAYNKCAIVRIPHQRVFSKRFAPCVGRIDVTNENNSFALLHFKCVFRNPPNPFKHKYGERRCVEYNLMIARPVGSRSTQCLMPMGMKKKLESLHT